MNKRIIAKVYCIKRSGQMLVTVPRWTSIKVGDFVQIEKLEMIKAKDNIIAHSETGLQDGQVQEGRRG